MLENYMTNNKRLFFYLVGFVGLFCLVWLVSVLMNVDGHNSSHKVSLAQSEKQADSMAVVNSLSEEESSTPLDFEYPENGLDQIKEDSSGVEDAVSLECTLRCDSALSMLDQSVELDDETFQKLGAYAEEIAVYLQNNEDQRRRYTQIALTTTDADKRAYLTDIFKRLPEQQRVEIADSFIDSSNWRARADGVTLIADNGVTNLEMGTSLVDIFLSEDNSYVKGKILTYLENSAALRGDTEVLRQLDSAIYYEAETSVRIAAFKAKMQLSEEPYHILPDALQALRTSEPDLQLAGLVAIEEVLRNEKKYTEKGAYIDTNSLENEFEIIRNLTAYGEDEKRFEYLIREANAIYLRYFSI